MSVVTVKNVPLVVCRLYQCFLHLLSVQNREQVSHINTVKM